MSKTVWNCLNLKAGVVRNLEVTLGSGIWWHQKATVRHGHTDDGKQPLICMLPFLILISELLFLKATTLFIMNFISQTPKKYIMITFVWQLLLFCLKIIHQFSKFLSFWSFEEEYKYSPKPVKVALYQKFNVTYSECSELSWLWKIAFLWWSNLHLDFVTMVKTASSKLFYKEIGTLETMSLFFREKYIFGK